MAFANAVDNMGVWSAIPMPIEDLMALRAIQVLPGTTTFTHSNRDVVVAWTQGAMKASSSFRERLKVFLEDEVQLDDNIFVRQGQQAALDSLKVLL